MSWIPALQIFLPLASAAILWSLGNKPRFQQWFAIGIAAICTCMSVLLMSIAGTGELLVTRFGNWPAPFAISFVVDRLSAIMSLAGNLLTFFCLIYSAADQDQQRIRFGLHSFLLLLMAGFNGAVLTADLFNLYVWLEVLLMSTLALLILGNQKPQLRSAIPYVTMNLLASTLILASIGLIYSISGSLNMAELSIRLQHIPERLVLGIATVFLVGICIKAAVFPLFFWLPSSYPTVPVAVTAAFSGLLTKVAVYSLIRYCTLLLKGHFELLQTPLLIIACLTMLSGVLGAAVQFDLRRILSFHIVSQIGYMLMGLALMSPLALAGAVFFMLHNMVVKSNLFLISGVAKRFGGTYELHGLGGMYTSHPWTALFFIISAFSLVGLPPLSGFWGKFMIINAGLQSQHYLSSAVALVVSLLTLYSMTKIWLMAFWKNAPSRPSLHSPWTVSKSPLYYSFIPVCALVFITLSPIFFIAPMGEYLMSMAQQLMNPTLYQNATLAIYDR